LAYYEYNSSQEKSSSRDPNEAVEDSPEKQFEASGDHTPEHNPSPNDQECASNHGVTLIAARD
jgi:hypothetical protein